AALYWRSAIFAALGGNSKRPLSRVIGLRASTLRTFFSILLHQVLIRTEPLRFTNRHGRTAYRSPPLNLGSCMNTDFAARAPGIPQFGPTRPKHGTGIGRAPTPVNPMH